MPFCRVNNLNEIAEIIQENPSGRYHPDLKWTEIAADLNPQCGDILLADKLYKRPEFATDFDYTETHWRIDPDWQFSALSEAIKNRYQETRQQLINAKIYNDAVSLSTPETNDKIRLRLLELEEREAEEIDRLFKQIFANEE